jgi:glucokinase
MKKQYAIGIGLNLLEAKAILLDREGKVVAEAKKARAKVSANETIEVILELFEIILAKTKKHSNDIQGVGLALGGIVNSKKGIVFWPESKGSYISIPLKEHLEKKFGFGVFITNDASACAWAEYNINFSKFKNIIYMFSGVGCGIITDARLYCGKDGGAGELFLNPQLTMSSRLGDFSIFSPWSMDLGMVKRANELISLGRNTCLVKKISSTGDLALKSILDASKKKDKVAREIVKEAAFSLGVKISMLINLLNPDAVIIGGGLESAGEPFLEECLSSVKKFAFNEMRKSCRISLSQLKSDATSLGAAMIVFKERC